ALSFSRIVCSVRAFSSGDLPGSYLRFSRAASDPAGGGGSGIAGLRASPVICAAACVLHDAHSSTDAANIDSAFIVFLLRSVWRWLLALFRDALSWLVCARARHRAWNGHTIFGAWGVRESDWRLGGRH